MGIYEVSIGYSCGIEWEGGKGLNALKIEPKFTCNLGSFDPKIIELKLKFMLGTINA